VAAKQEVFRTDSNAYSLNISEFKLDQDAYKDQQERLRDARTLLLSTINPAIRFTISHHLLPSDLMDALKDMCKMNDEHAKSLVYQHLDALKYTDFDSISDLIHSLTSFQHELTALGETYGDEQIISKVLTLLPTEYGEWKRFWNFAAGSATLPRSVTTMHSQLMHEEAQLKAAGKLTKKGNSSKDKSKDKDKDKSKEGGGDELHMCKHCNKMVKHKEKNCYVNPENKDKAKP